MYRYPFGKYQRHNFTMAMFGDATVLYRRSRAPAQTELGTLTCPEELLINPSRRQECKTRFLDYDTWIDSTQVYNNYVITQPTLAENTWTTTGLFALPGRPINVTRLDNNGSYIETGVNFWFQVGDSKRFMAGPLRHPLISQD
jgi:hypothetical protein